jgi:hypothetical protein
VPANSILVYEDERGGSIVAKTYGGTSCWSCVQSKVSKAQKIRGILNVFGFYYHINNHRCLLMVTERKQENIFRFYKKSRQKI